MLLSRDRRLSCASGAEQLVGRELLRAQTRSIRQGHDKLTASPESHFSVFYHCGSTEPLRERYELKCSEVFSWTSLVLFLLSLLFLLAVTLPETSPQVASDKAFCDTLHYSWVINVSPPSTLCAVIKD